MYSDDRSRIVAYLANIGKQINDMPSDLSSAERERLQHLMWMRDSLSRAFRSISPAHPAMMTLASTLP